MREVNSDHIINYGNEILEELSKERDILNTQLKKYNGISFDDFAEYNISILKLEELIKSFKEEIKEVEEKQSFDDPNKIMNSSISTEIKLYNCRLTVLETYLMFYKSRSHSLNKSCDSYVEREIVGGISYGKQKEKSILY